jgi:hypothetical protein
MPVTTCCSTSSSSSQMRVPGGRPSGQTCGASGSSKLERTKVRRHAPSPFQRSAPEAPSRRERPFRAFPQRRPDQGVAPGHDARVGRVDPVNIGIDITPVSLDRRRDRNRAGVGAAPAKRRDPVVGRNALKAGENTAPGPCSSRSISRSPSISRCARHRDFRPS